MPTRNCPDLLRSYDGKRPKKGLLFGGARLTIEPGSDFPIGVNNLGFRVAAAQPSRWIPRRTGPAVHLSRSAPHRSGER